MAPGGRNINLLVEPIVTERLRDFSEYTTYIRESERRKERETDRHTETETGRPTSKQTNRLTDRQIDKHTTK